MSTQWEDFWWSKITGPHEVVAKAAELLSDNKMVALKVPTDIPWRHSMRKAICDAFKDHDNSSYMPVFDWIDFFDDNHEQEEPGKFVLDKYAQNGDIKCSYREKSSSIQQYISVNGVIKNHIIWVKGLDKTSTAKWLEFCRGFSKKCKAGGLFVLELHENPTKYELGALKLIDFEEYVSNYDLQLFNGFVLDEKKYKDYSDAWKRYISTCTARVCGIDAELSEFLLDSVEFKSESINEGIKRAAELPDFARRGTQEDSSHILRSYRCGDEDKIEQKVWSAQLEALFPIIELERIKLIDRYEKEIQCVLDSEEIYQYGNRLKNAIDAELGTLCYLMRTRNDDENHHYKLYIPHDEDRERIGFIHECRNKLAHMTCCSPSEVQQLLDGHEYAATYQY